MEKHRLSYILTVDLYVYGTYYIRASFHSSEDFVGVVSAVGGGVASDGLSGGGSFLNSHSFCSLP